MALRKHDSVVVLEIIAAFALMGTFTIALMLSFIHQDLKAMSTAKTSAPASEISEEKSEKITIQDLDPALLQEINKSFSTLEVSQKQSQAALGFYLQKVLKKQFSEEELKAIDEELKAQIEAAQEAAQKAQAEATNVQKNPEAQAK